MIGDEREEVTRLLAENRRRRELLTEHGIAWQPRDITPTTDRSTRLGTDVRIKCGDCQHRALIPVTGQTVFDHLAGRHTVGVSAALG